MTLTTGEGIGGLGLGCALDPVPVSVDGDGWLAIGSAAWRGRV